VFDRSTDVKFKLKLHTFKPFVKDSTIYIKVSEVEIKHNRFSRVLADPSFAEIAKKMKLPYIVGTDSMGEIVIEDLADFKHLLIGGSSGSGKTIALLILILCLIGCKSEREVNLLIIDVGANDLALFNATPHLSCPVIRDAETGLGALKALAREMDRRRDFELNNKFEFNLLPRIVCVIDEFSALVSGIGDESKLLTSIISSLLQRGRHYGIHLVLAAQNPTLRNMGVDLSNITSRMAFACAKSNFSMTILDELGAEKLAGNGDMYLKTPSYDGLQRIQGAYITSRELSHMLRRFKLQNHQIDNPYKFEIDAAILQQDEEDISNVLTKSSDKGKRSADDKFLAQIIIWALERETVSSNMICDTFNVGWRRAKRFLDRLNELEIAGDLDAKLPRAVLPIKVEDLSKKVIDILERNGYTEDRVREALRY